MDSQHFSFGDAWRAVVGFAASTFVDLGQAVRTYIGFLLRISALAVPTFILSFALIIFAPALPIMQHRALYLIAICVTSVTAIVLLAAWYPLISGANRLAHIPEAQKWLPSSRWITGAAWTGVYAATLTFALPTKEEPSLLYPILIVSVFTGVLGTSSTGDKVRKLVLTKSVIALVLLSLKAYFPFSAAALTAWRQLSDHLIASAMLKPERLEIGLDPDAPLLKSNGEPFMMFLPTGLPQLYFYRLPSGEYEFYTRQGTRPQGGTLELADTKEETDAINAWLMAKRQSLQRQAALLEQQRDDSVLAELRATQRIIRVNALPLRLEASYQSDLLVDLPAGDTVVVNDSLNVNRSPTYFFVSRPTLIRATQGQITVPAWHAVVLLSETPDGPVISYRSTAGEIIGLAPRNALEQNSNAVETWYKIQTRRSEVGFVPARLVARVRRPS
jgi:hypothetical protein